MTKPLPAGKNGMQRATKAKKGMWGKPHNSKLQGGGKTIRRAVRGKTDPNRDLNLGACSAEKKLGKEKMLTRGCKARRCNLNGNGTPPLKKGR